MITFKKFKWWINWGPSYTWIYLQNQEIVIILFIFDFPGSGTAWYCWGGWNRYELVAFLLLVWIFKRLELYFIFWLVFVYFFLEISVSMISVVTAEVGQYFFCHLVLGPLQFSYMVPGLGHIYFFPSGPNFYFTFFPYWWCIYFFT